MPNQPNSADNRRVSLVCPDVIDRKKNYLKEQWKIQFDYNNKLLSILSHSSVFDQSCYLKHAKFGLNYIKFFIQIFIPFLLILFYSLLSIFTVEFSCKIMKVKAVSLLHTDLQLNYFDFPLTTYRRQKGIWWALAKVLVGSIDLNGICINSYKKYSYYCIIMFLLFHNETQCSKRSILSYLSVAVADIYVSNMILYQMLETNLKGWKHAVQRQRKGQE